MGHRARAGRRGARGGPARARDDRGGRTGGGAVPRRRARRDRLPAAGDGADLGRGDDGGLTAAARRDAGAPRRRGKIVRTHVDDALTGLPDAERDAAAEALRFLVTSGGRKIALSTTELREFTDAPAQPLESALERLERHRILRPVAASETDGAVRRELYHDVLASAVLDWRRRHVEERERQAADRKLADARGRARSSRSATAASPRP